jgi:hypothetical protein
MIIDNIDVEFNDVKEIIARFGMFAPIAPIAPKSEPLGNSRAFDLRFEWPREQKKFIILIISEKSEPESRSGEFFSA